MKDLFRWLRRNKTERREEIDLESITPLVHLVEHVEPDADLFSRIERTIDAQAAATKKAETGPRSTRWVLLAVFAMGLGIGLSVANFFQSRQGIVAQSNATGSWIPLGSVTLQGSVLRGFVRKICEGQTHFFITVHGFHVEKNGKQETNAPLFTNNQEKIRMECIFL